MDSAAAERQVVIAVVVERVYVSSLHRLRIRTAHAPLAALVVHKSGVVGLAQVRALANRYKSLGLKPKYVPSQSQSQRPAGQPFGESDEGLLNIEPVLVDRGTLRFAGRNGVLELREDLDVVTESKVRVPFEPTEDPLSALARRSTEKCRVIEFNTFPEIDPKGYIGVWMSRVERDVLEIVQRLPLDSRVGKHRPILLRSTVGTDLRPFGRRLRGALVRRVLGTGD